MRMLMTAAVIAVGGLVACSEPAPAFEGFDDMDKIENHFAEMFDCEWREWTIAGGPKRACATGENLTTVRAIYRQANDDPSKMIVNIYNTGVYFVPDRLSEDEIIEALVPFGFEGDKISELLKRERRQLISDRFQVEYYNSFGTYDIKVGPDVRSGFLRVRRRT